MKTLGDLLLNYKIPGVRDAQIRKICAEEVCALTGCELAPAQVRYKHDELILNVAPILKSQLLMRQTELLERIRARDVQIRSLR
jgi:hypothetical protein